MKTEELIRYSQENLYQKNKIKGPSVLMGLIFIGIIALLSLPLISVEISSQARGIARPFTDNIPIISLQSGRILSLPIKNNEFIVKGQKILELDHQEIDNLLGLEQTQSDISNKKQQDLTQLINSENPLLFTPELKEDYFYFSLQKKELKTKLFASKIIFERQNKLFQEKVIPKVEWEKAEFDLKQIQESLESFEQNKKKEWTLQLEKEHIQENSRLSTIRKLNLEKNNLKVFSPADGTIIQFKGLKPGTYLPAGLEIAQISPNDSLIIECQVLPQDIGLIYLGQKQKLAIDAFNFRQWGWLTAEVMEINRNLFQNENQFYFLVKSKIIRNQLQLKNGTKVKIQKGMTLTAHFYLTKRSLLNLLTDKIDDWYNPKIYKNGLYKN